MISIYITDRDIISGEEGGDDSADPSLLGAHGDYATKSSVTFVWLHLETFNDVTWS